MACTLNVKLVLKHLVNGDFEENFCRICLQPLTELCEDIFTKVCKEDQEYCVADILEELCGFKFAETDNYFVCAECFLNASNSYKFYLNTKRNNEILTFYINEIESNVNAIEIPDRVLTDALCISLPECTPATPDFNYNLEGVLRQVREQTPEIVKKVNDETPNSVQIDSEHIVIIKSEDGTQTMYKPLPDGRLIEMFMDKKKQCDNQVVKKTRKKREPMLYRQCSLCPIKYRFIAKLKEHMRTEHGINLHVCKICQALIEDEEEFRQHIRTHTNVHQCELCDTMFRRRDTMIAHLKWHEGNRNANGKHVCTACGEIAKDDEELREHIDKKHSNSYTCYYCGRMYRGKVSFDQHIHKHETYLKQGDKRKKSEKRVIELKQKPAAEPPKQDGKRFTCETCGRNFLGKRALVWHTRLHTNERPYACHVCGKGFVSENRLKQHALCAHTVPTRRCPLCPALFHLRSMVNTHIKKVHLKAHKRRNRTMRPQQVFWDTQTVPIQELSVSIQNELLEFQAREKEAMAQESENMHMSGIKL